MDTIKCKRCDKEFRYEVKSMNVPGGKDREVICCPYCGEENGTEITSGIIYTYKIEKSNNVLLHKLGT